MIEIEYEVIERFDDAAPEPFGIYRRPLDLGEPNVGEDITLKWLSGADAYIVKIEQIDGMTLYVRHDKRSM